MSKTLAHLSDLHLGMDAHSYNAARRLCRLILEAGIDHTVVTGDITHRGRRTELAKFFRIFAPLIETGRLTAIPGNHDRNRDGAGTILMKDVVQTRLVSGLFLVQVNTTAPHNKAVISSHGILTQSMCDQIGKALDTAPMMEPVLRVILMHHHVLPLPTESFWEWFAYYVGWPNAQELDLGKDLLNQVMGKCDMILHGHRHIPRAMVHINGLGEQIPLFNAGSSTQLEGFRVFHHEAGKVEQIEWIGSSPPTLE